MITRQLSFFVIATCLFVITAREVPSPPRITKQPPTDEVLFQVGTEENDKPFFIECEAIGEPPPTYRWIKNGKHFDWQAYDDRISQQPGRGTLSISKPKDVDIGQYQCFAENEWGTATSNSVFMRKAELNSFKNTLIMPHNGNEGEPFKLSCQPPDGWPKPKVHWMIQYTTDGVKSINNSRMTLDPEGNLWFSNLTREDATNDFFYACAASSSTKLEYKIGNRVLLNVLASGVSPAQNKHEPVYQYATKRNEAALRGKSAELYCIYGGTPLPLTVWSKNGRLIQSSDKITQGNYGKSLIIKMVDFEDEGTYTCEVSNGVGEPKSYSINLRVLAVPYFTKEPQFITAAEDETVEFKCEASGVPKPEIKWIHNGKPISEAPQNLRRRVTSNSIIIERVKKSDTGNYGCNATNSMGYVYKDVYVNVLALPPEITEAPKDLEAVNSQSINMTCKVYGAPKPLVKWIRNGKELTGGKYTILESGDLNINNVQFDDSGTYTCYAANKLGSVNATANFVVKEHTRITDNPEDYEVQVGNSATFRCNAVSDPTLKLEIIWLRNGAQIDFEYEPRFVKSSDYSLTISKTIELDSGTYTCVARTNLDQDTASASLIVQDVPNPPVVTSIKCEKKEATLEWKPMGDNRAPILRYTIERNTSFTPDTWDVMYSSVPAADTSYTLPLSPWANFTFRVIAWNKVGASQPSGHSEVCTTGPEVPHKNPDNVEGMGDKPDNLVIQWTPMPEIEHNGPRFSYKIYYKKNITGESYQTDQILDWRQSRYEVLNQPSFTQYLIKVVAINALGEANVAPKVVEGYSGENEPLQAPGDFTLITIPSATTALVSWIPVSPSSVRGHFRGYKIKTWTENSNYPNEIQVQGDAKNNLITNLVPFTKNFAQVYVYNDKYNGPPSETLTFTTPEGVPGPVKSLDAYPMGSEAFYLKWEKPEQPNGNLIGYNIYFAFVNGTNVGDKLPRKPQITDPNQLSAKLAKLKPNNKYRLYVTATSSAGESEPNFIERVTRGVGVTKPAIPDFDLFREQSETGLVTIKVVWRPVLYNNPGSHFIVKYRRKGEPNYIASKAEFDEDYINITGLEPSTVYEFILVAVDGDQHTESLIKEVDTADGPLIQPKENVANAGWFIGMMLAIAILILILIVVCIVKRNRGGKYAVHEREQANGRRDYPDEGGFHEYSQPLDNKSHGRASVSSEAKIGPESDTDSMAEYGEGDTEGMNEDGSFIGQYGRKARPGETTSQGFATLV